MFESLVEGFYLLARWDTFGVIGIGLFLGMFVGALPGFTTVMAMSLILPISFFLHPLVGIPFLIGVYKGGIYGGSIPAILIAVPGTGAAIATTMDGPQLAQRGEGRKALEMALYASVFGDLVSDIVTLFMIAPIALIALLVGPPELSVIILIALVIIAAASTGALIKGLAMAFFGIMLSMIGQDPLGFMTRFTFGSLELKSGIPLLPMMIGVFAIPEILAVLERLAVSKIKGTDPAKLSSGGERLHFHEFKKCFRTICRSTLIGTVIGALPGAGQSVAAFAGYAAAKKNSSHPETFGTGEIEGIAAAEAANNAVNGPTLVPLLTLGIPGDKVTAILLGAFVAHNLRPGPQLMSEHGPLVYALLLAMIAANVMFLVIAYVSIPIFARIVTLKRFYLIPIIVLTAFAGSYVFRSDPVDLQYLVYFGVFGYFARKLDFDVVPMVMAFILAPTLEYTIGQTINMADGSLFEFMFLQRPSAGILYIMLFATLAYFGFKNYKSNQVKRQPASLIGEDTP
jgi:putative tricarboxylic transport membrane protein